MTLLELGDYREAIDLDLPFTPTAPPTEPHDLAGSTRNALRLLAREPSAGPLGLTSEPPRASPSRPEPRRSPAATTCRRGS
ncbi:hypothetical protein [Glycomyces rhizosphaerae]|uniref:Tetratricopeptide repeat protein n=1 Tax=Glycomyces rhizosphaerae TaxID=2054422 RepID=A0ABV7Q8F3_9ACTN